MKCTRCQLSQPEGARFCIECGHRLTPASSSTPQFVSFEEKLEKIQRYLPKGLTEKILAQKDKIEGERKHVTIMFCDMKGFTPLAEKLGPEETFSLMDQVFEILIHEVHRSEGIVNELRGDGILALFGAPIAVENAPQKAIHAAISIHREIAAFNEKIRSSHKIPPILLRIGINTGPVIVGTLGNDLRVNFTAVGDTINLASRMEGLAAPGTTYVTGETFRLTDGLFRFEALGRKTIKGKKEAIPVYKILSAKEDVYRPRLGSERMIYSEMVGRDRELDKLELQLMKVINGEGSVVNIIGEGGIGKSRLIAELKNRAAVKRVVLLEGMAISIGRNLSFHPIIDMLKQWAQIRKNDSEAAAFYKLETAVRKVCLEDAYEVLPFLATLMGMNLSGRYQERIKGIEGEALKKLILRGMQKLLIKAADRTPLVFVTEDLHWIDTSSLELLESLFRLTEQHRILFVNVFRPGHKETGDRLIETIKERIPVYSVEIMLEPLDDRMSEALVTNMLKSNGLHHPIIEQIVQRASGNPFFIEEIVRSLIDDCAVVLKDGTFQVTEKINTIAIPNTINELLMVRIDRLEEETRQLVKVASVIGRNFFHRILIEVVKPLGDIDTRLSYLKEVEILRERRRMDEVEYLFTHALAQEAAYESILPRRRKEIHLKVADSIEKIFAERLHEFYGMLSYHYSMAENLDKAEKYLIKAGEEARRSAASDEALHFYEAALSLYLEKSGNHADREKVAMLEQNIALALYNRGQHEEAVGHFDRTLEHYWGKLPQNPLSRAIKFLSSFLHLVTALHIPYLKFRATPSQRDLLIFDLFYKKCKALAITNPKRFFIEFFFLHKKISSYDLQRFENGTSLFVSASPLFSFSGISFGLSRKLLDFVKHMICEDDVRASSIYEICETMHNFLEGNWKEIKNYDDDLIKKNCDIGEIWDAAQILYWHALPCIYQGSLGIVESILNRLEGLFQVYQYNLAKTYEYELTSCLLTECRRFNDALSEIKKGIEFEERSGQGFWGIYVCEARVYLALREIDKAAKCLAQAKRICRQIRPVPFQMTGLYRAELEYDLYRLQEMFGNADRKLLSKYRRKAFRSVKLLLRNVRKVAQYRTESYKLTGEYYWMMNRQKTALAWWHRAIKEGEFLGARLQLAGVYSGLGKRLLEPGSRYRALDGIDAEDYLEMAKSTLEEMELQSYLDEP